MISPYYDTAVGRLTFVPACAEDAETVLSIMQEASQWLRSRGITQWSWTFTEEGAAHIARRIVEGGVFLAFLGEEAVGVIRLLWEDAIIWGEPGADGQAGYVHMFAIRRTVGGQGVGEAMLRWAETMFAAAGRRYIRLDTNDNNAGICAYYERLGFESRGISLSHGNAVRLYEKVIQEKQP